MKNLPQKILAIGLTLLLPGCMGIPAGVEPVQDFQLDRYLGKWYEIARLDHSFERGLERVSANYSLRDNGTVRVINRGYAIDTGKLQEAEGTAGFARGRSEGYLKVSFFGPFYGSYIVFELDRVDYQYAFVAGNSTDYLWLLARTPTVDKAVLNSFIEKSRSLGFDTDNLILVRQQ